MIKGVSLWHTECKEIFTFLLDSDAALGYNVTGAKAIDMSFMKLDPNTSSSFVKKTIYYLIN